MKLMMTILCSFLAMTVLSLFGCSQKTDPLQGNGDNDGKHVIELQANTNRLIKNPLMGWGIYSDAYNPNPNFWSEFDALQITRYATHLYIRWPWSAFEPQKGHYAWNNDPFFIQLENGAKERGLKLAFRVYVDSRDYNTSSTPSFVRDAGASGVIGNTNQWSPYPDDPIFQQHYADFVRAMAARFDDPDVVDYVDGFGLGKWGEGHSMILQNDDNYDQMYEWIVNLYSESFENILVAINYHSDIGKPRLDWAFNEHDYILRHDAFGMGNYYIEFEKEMTKEHFPNRPIIAESGWWHNGSDHWTYDDPANYKTWRDVWAQTLKDALAERANTLDLRNISEAASWIQTAPDLVQHFISEGGYRLYPAKVWLPKTIERNVPFQIEHEWHNLGVGVCPNNVRQWGHKYKVAFALLDSDSREVVHLFMDERAEPSEWLKGAPKKYILDVDIQNHGVQTGNYKFAVAIVDSKKGNEPGLNLALQGSPTSKGWWEIGDVSVR